MGPTVPVNPLGPPAALLTATVAAEAEAVAVALALEIKALASAGVMV